MNLWQRLHRDEKGLEALQVVMIVAIAAVILALVKLNWNTIKNWYVTSMAEVMSWIS